MYSCMFPPLNKVVPVHSGWKIIMKGKFSTACWFPQRENFYINGILNTEWDS